MGKEGLTEAIHDALRGKVRQAAGRNAEPSAVILDAQTVKTSGNVPEHSQGIDAGKKIKGTKRHVATDVPGLLLVVLVTAASVQDTVGGRAVIDQVARHHPRVVVAWVDSGYKQSVIDTGAAYGIDVQVERPAAARVRAPAQKVGGRKDVRLVDVASTPGPGLRDQPTTIPGDDSLGDDRQHVSAIDRRINSVLA